MKHFREDQFRPQVHLSSLAKGMTVRLEVVSMRYLNGRDGSTPHFISYGRTLVAIEVPFTNHEPVVESPDQQVALIV
jgi:hypothetical protein